MWLKFKYIQHSSFKCSCISCLTSNYLMTSQHIASWTSLPQVKCHVCKGFCCMCDKYLNVCALLWKGKLSFYTWLFFTTKKQGLIKVFVYMMILNLSFWLVFLPHLLSVMECAKCRGFSICSSHFQHSAILSKFKFAFYHNANNLKRKKPSTLNVPFIFHHIYKQRV